MKALIIFQLSLIVALTALTFYKWVFVIPLCLIVVSVAVSIYFCHLRSDKIAALEAKVSKVETNLNNYLLAKQIQRPSRR